MKLTRPHRAARVGLPRNVVVLSWVSFFADTASEMLYPIFPTFVTQTLGASASILGLIEGVADGTAAAGQAVSRRLADRFRRRPLIALGTASPRSPSHSGSSVVPTPPGRWSGPCWALDFTS